MQKFFPQSSVWAKPQSLAALGLSLQLPSGSRSFPAPTARMARRDNRCRPTSTAKKLEPPTEPAAKATWPHHALGCWPHERRPALADPSYPPRYDVCGLSRSWLCRSLLAPFFRRLDALAVQYNSTGLNHAPGFEAHFCAQGIMQLFQRAVAPPAPVTRMNRAPIGKLAGQHSPLATGSQNVENRVDDATPLDLCWTTKILFDKGVNALPLDSA